MATEVDVVSYMKVSLGPIVDAVQLTDDALTQAAGLTAAAYGDTFENFTDALKWKALADFFAVNAALNYAVPFFKFTADGSSVTGSDIFNQLQQRWRSALALAQTYLADTGMQPALPGSPPVVRNSGLYHGVVDTNYLNEENV